MICHACRRAAAASMRIPRIPARSAVSRLHRFATPVSPPLRAHMRLFSAAPALQQDLPIMTPAESAIADILAEKLSPSELLVQDVSGGCGSMYAIEIASSQFRGLSILKQQRLVNAALGDLVKSWHGVQIRTKVPEE